MKNGDLPGVVEKYSGSFVWLRLSGSPDLTIIESNSFPQLSFEVIVIGGMENLETIEQNFLQGGEASVTDMYIQDCINLRYVSKIMMYTVTENEYHTLSK